MSNPWNSECVSPHMCFGGTPEEEGLFLPEHFLFRLLLLCLLIVRALCRVMIKGQYRNFIILHNDSCSLKPGSHVCLLVLTWPGRCWMQSSSGFWFCADQMSSSTPNRATDFFMDLALRTGALSCWSRKETNTNCRHRAGRSHCVL